MELETFIWMFCIMVMLGLTARTVDTSFNTDCNMCTVDLTNTQAITNQQYTIENVSIPRLIERYKIDGKCLITWDPTQGYIKNGY